MLLRSSGLGASGSVSSTPRLQERLAATHRQVLRLGRLIDELLEDAGDRMQKAVEAIRREFTTVWGSFELPGGPCGYASAQAHYEALLADAQLFLARSYYNDEQFILAASEFTRFMELYRNDPRAPQAEYERAMAYYRQSPEYQLDQTDTERAISYFQLFLDRHPGSEFVDEAEVRVRELREKLAHKQYATGGLYEQRELYDVFRRVGSGMGIPGLPATYAGWKADRERHLRRDLVRSAHPTAQRRVVGIGLEQQPPLGEPEGAHDAEHRPEIGSGNDVDRDAHQRAANDLTPIERPGQVRGCHRSGTGCERHRRPLGMLRLERAQTGHGLVRRNGDRLEQALPGERGATEEPRRQGRRRRHRLRRGGG